MPHQKLRQQNAGCTDNNSIRTNGRLCLLPTFVIGKTSFNLNAVYQWFKIKSPSSAAVIKLSIRPPTIEQNDQPLKMTDEFFDRTSPTPLSCFVRHLCLSSPARRPLSSYSSQSTRSTSARAHVSTLRKEVDEALNIIRSVPEAISQSLAVKNELSGAPEKKTNCFTRGKLASSFNNKTGGSHLIRQRRKLISGRTVWILLLSILAVDLSFVRWRESNLHISLLAHPKLLHCYFTTRNRWWCFSLDWNITCVGWLDFTYSIFVQWRETNLHKFVGPPKTIIHCYILRLDKRWLFFSDWNIILYV